MSSNPPDPGWWIPLLTSVLGTVLGLSMRLAIEVWPGRIFKRHPWLTFGGHRGLRSGRGQ